MCLVKYIRKTVTTFNRIFRNTLIVIEWAHFVFALHLHLDIPPRRLLCRYRIRLDIDETTVLLVNDFLDWS